MQNLKVKFEVDLFRLDERAAENVKEVLDKLSPLPGPAKEWEVTDFRDELNNVIAHLQGLIPVADGSLVTKDGMTETDTDLALSAVSVRFDLLNDPYGVKKTKAERKALEKQKKAVCRMFAAYAMGYADAMMEYTVMEQMALAEQEEGKE